MAGKEKIGWIGLGKMGAPMAKNMVKAGFPLTVWNRTREKTKELAELGTGGAWRDGCRYASAFGFRFGCGHLHDPG